MSKLEGKLLFVEDNELKKVILLVFFEGPLRVDREIVVDVVTYFVCFS